VRRCAWPHRGGSIVGVKKGRRSAAEAFIATRWGGGQVTGGATRRRGAWGQHGGQAARHGR
jgi:hypothetical protein